MVVITLVGILGAMALPSMTGLLKNNRLTAQANSLIGMMQYARNEAINRGHNIVIQPLVAATSVAGWSLAFFDSCSLPPEGVPGFSPG